MLWYIRVMIAVTYGTAQVQVTPATYGVVDDKAAENYEPHDLAQAVLAVVRSWDYPMSEFVALLEA